MTGQPAPQAAYARWLDACARAGWRRHDPGQAACEELPLAAALGRVAATPVAARWPSPRCACAAMDGIALTGGRPGREERIPAGEFTVVDTGDPMPPGTDTVVQRERVAFDADGGARVSGPVRPGSHVRAAGEDFQAGEVLIPAGRRLRPADLAVAAAAGHVTIAVLRPPQIAIIPTGDEIRPAGAPLHHGDIVESNSFMLAGRAAQLGAQPTVTAVVPDDPAALADAFRAAAATADLVLVIAGSSRGRDDHTAAVLAEVGGVAVAGVAVRPGHPVVLGHVKADKGTVPAIGVPGYPLAAAVIFEIFARPLIAEAPLPRHAELDTGWVSPPEIEDWLPVALRATPGSTLATPARRGAGSASQLVRADAWWRVPAGQGTFARGARIEVLPLGLW
jgi:putative molybdopterin biosynthesis protein